MYNIIGINQFHKSVAKFGRWPTYKGGQFHRFYCIFMLGKFPGNESFRTEIASPFSMC
jgi:hypothetical protein